MKIRSMVRCALFAAFLTVCAWLSVPVGNTVFTMQSFGLFLTLMVFGGKWGTVTVAVYLLLGATGLPVFSGFRGGLGVLLGPTGGYLWGFLGSALVYWLTERFWKNPVLSCILALLTCYTAGTVWYVTSFMVEGGVWMVLLQCVVPYLLPDGAKLLLAWLLSRRLKQYIRQ